MSGVEYTYVEEPGALERLARDLEAASSHALDTESNSGFAYQEKLCLLQVNVGGRLWVVDLVALAGREAIERLRPTLESSERTTLLHGGEFDVGCFKRDYDIELRAVWDSQQAASYLGDERTGYAAVVEEVTGVVLPKSYTQHDWARRPLEPKVLEYAVDDVRYLPAICDRLKERVKAADLEEEVAIGNRVVEESTWEGGYRPDGFWKIRGVGALPTSSLPFLAALWAWRDEVARAEDRAPGRTINNRVLLAVSRRPPKKSNDLRRLGLPRRLMARGDELMALIDEVRRSPPDVPKRPQMRPRLDPASGRLVRGREDRLKKWRAKEASRRGVPLQAVLPSRALDHLKRHGTNDLERVPQLGPKRIRLYGEQLRELLD